MSILNRGSCCIYNQFKYSHYIVKSLQGTTGYLTLVEWSSKATITIGVYIRISVNKVDLQHYCAQNMTICAVNVPEPRVKSLFTVCVSLSLHPKSSGKW